VAPDQEKNMATAEVINMPNTATMAPPESCMIAAEDLWKTYDMGSEQKVHALRGESADSTQRVRRHHGSVRLG